MEYLQQVRKTDLARNTRQIIQKVQRGQSILIESHGQPEAVILDVTDYYILRAVARYYAQPSRFDLLKPLEEEQLASLQNPQERFDLVIANYLAEAISLGRAAELLDLPWVDLRLRFAHLDVPLRLGPATFEEALDEVRAAREWDQKARR